MKYKLSLCLLIIALNATAKEYHKFTNTKGQTLLAHLIRYNDSKKTVFLDCKGKGGKTVPISVFSEEDQQYILDWNLSKKFFDNKVLTVSFKKKKEKLPEKTIDHEFDVTFFWDAWIDVVIQNKSASSFDDVTVEYTLYYTEEIPKGGYENRNESEKKLGTIYAKQTLNLRKNSKAPFSTEKVELSVYSGREGLWPSMKGEMEGMILKMSFKLNSGETIVRTIRYPKNLEREWTTENQTIERNW